MIRLKLCNGFSKPYLSFQRIRMKRSLYQGMMTEQAVVGLGHVFVEWTTSALPLKLYGKHPRIERTILFSAALWADPPADEVLRKDGCPVKRAAVWILPISLSAAPVPLPADRSCLPACWP